MSYRHTNINIISTAKQFGQICQTVIAVDQSCKSHNVSVRHPSMHRSEQKCAHLRSERCTAGRFPRHHRGHRWLSVESPPPRGGAWRTGWRRHLAGENERKWPVSPARCRLRHSAGAARRRPAEKPRKWQDTVSLWNPYWNFDHQVDLIIFYNHQLNITGSIIVLILTCRGAVHGLLGAAVKGWPNVGMSHISTACVKVTHITDISIAVVRTRSILSL